MILIFDLDDTLYEELSYVKSGFSAVAEYGESAFGWDKSESLSLMLNILALEGRGSVFDRWLQHNKCYSRKLVLKCLGIYRTHTPRLCLPDSTKEVLDYFFDLTPLYIVTDGNKIVQGNKVRALNLQCYFRRIFITHRFGVRHSKPSIYCFEKIKSAENCSWSDMVYVGDNPSKDFVNLNPLGVLTIRVLTGPYRDAEALPGYDASLTIQDLSQLANVLKERFTS